MIADMYECSSGPTQKASATIAVTFESSEIVCDTWEGQVREERRILLAAATMVQDIRRSSVHRKLPHYHSVDRQLQMMQEQLVSISQSVDDFWRYGRDEPMQQLLILPSMRLAATIAEHGSIVPVSLGFVKELVETGTDDEDPASDAAALGICGGAAREVIESAYRRRARHYHRNGKCFNEVGFHALTTARDRCVARISAPQLKAYSGGGDIIAHYLLVGTDPGESRYRECSCAILDAVHRGKLLERIQVLNWSCWSIPLTWGDEDDEIRFGGPNHIGAAG